MFASAEREREKESEREKTRVRERERGDLDGESLHSQHSLRVLWLQRPATGLVDLQRFEDQQWPKKQV
jgi:hypothetical protein